MLSECDCVIEYSIRSLLWLIYKNVNTLQIGFTILPSQVKERSDLGYSLKFLSYNRPLKLFIQRAMVFCSDLYCASWFSFLTNWWGHWLLYADLSKSIFWISQTLFSITQWRTHPVNLSTWLLQQYQNYQLLQLLEIGLFFWDDLFIVNTL